MSIQVKYIYIPPKEHGFEMNSHRGKNRHFLENLV
jgi:hypothetical protein